MFARGIRANIVINMAVILLIAMLLINVVLIFITQRYLLDRVSVDADFICHTFDILYKKQLTDSSDHINLKLNDDITRPLREKGVVALIILKSDGSQDIVIDDNSAIREELSLLLKRTQNEKHPDKKFVGTGWGVLWRYNKFLLKTMPVDTMDGGNRVYGIALSLGAVHKTLIKLEKIALLYLTINLILLTVFGSYRIFKIVFRPVQRLVKRAEEYKEHNDFFFNVRDEDDELGKLSSALNNMLNRIAKDKLKLRTTVDNLENVNQKLTTAQNEIIKAEKLISIGRLSAGIAHEIGNPIGIVIGYLDLLKQEGLDTKVRNDYIKRAESEINRINRIIRELLKFSRSDSEKVDTVRIHEIVDEVLEVFDKQPMMSGIKIEKQLNAIDDRVVADAEQLRQVFLNIIINATDALLMMGDEHKGRITISTVLEASDDQGLSVDSNQLKIAITDNGPGISRDEIAKVFDPFYTTKDPGKGTGLGLYVSLTIIEKFNGTISAARNPEGYTTMMIQLPGSGETK